MDKNWESACCSCRAQGSRSWLLNLQTGIRATCGRHTATYHIC